MLSMGRGYSEQCEKTISAKAGVRMAAMAILFGAFAVILVYFLCFNAWLLACDAIYGRLSVRDCGLSFVICAAPAVFAYAFGKIAVYMLRDLFAGQLITIAPDAFTDHRIGHSVAFRSVKSIKVLPSGRNPQAIRFVCDASSRGLHTFGRLGCLSKPKAGEVILSIAGLDRSAPEIVALVRRFAEVRQIPIDDTLPVPRLF